MITVTSSARQKHGRRRCGISRALESLKSSKCNQTNLQVRLNLDVVHANLNLNCCNHRMLQQRNAFLYKICNNRTLVLHRRTNRCSHHQRCHHCLHCCPLLLTSCCNTAVHPKHAQKLEISERNLERLSTYEQAVQCMST